MWFNGYKAANRYRQVINELEDKQLLVVEAVNQVIVEILNSEGDTSARFENWFQEILAWEDKEAERQVVFIGTDIGKGIVLTFLDLHHD